MKRSIAIILIACANLILLAHTILPHHHHDGIAVTLTLERTDDKHNHHDHHHHSNSNDHNNDEASNQEDCMLTDLLEQTILNNRYNVVSTNIENFCCTLFAFTVGPNIDFVPESQSITHRPYLLQENIFPDIRHNSLRGPPAC